jgi:hypothetical protein
LVKETGSQNIVGDPVIRDSTLQQQLEFRRTTMKRFAVLTSASLVAMAIAFGGAGTLYADAMHAQAGKTETVAEQVSGGPDVKAQTEMSEHGLAAMNDIQMARLAVNDGYVDNARKLLGEAKTLLEQVKEEDVPVTVTTEVKVGDKPVKKETVTKQPDLIPILAKMQLVEGYAEASGDRSDDAGAQAASKPDAPKQAKVEPADANVAKADTASQAAAAEKPTSEARAAAVAQARQQMREGDRAGAIETLRLVDLGLVSQVVSMPLAETSEHVDKALSLIDKDQLHEANLELKQAADALVVETQVIVEPAIAAPAGDDDQAQSSKSG